METTDTKVTIKDHSIVRGLVNWLVALASVIILVTAGVAIYTVRQLLPLVGYVAIFVVCFVPLLALIYGVIWIVKYVTKGEIIEIGPNGEAIKQFNKLTLIHPLGIQEYRGHSSKEKKAEDPIEIPSLLSLLKEGAFSNGDLLLGYRENGSARWGMWNDVRTFVVAGKSRSGKTVTMVFFIVQALLNGAVVYVCDPHWNKRTGLIKVIEPLLPFMQVAKRPEEIITLVKQFTGEMKAREDGLSTMGLVPMLLVVDEWTKLLRDLNPEEIDILVNAVLDCGEAWANFEGYAMIAGHEWTARESGGKKGAALRRAFHATFVHRIDEEYAKFLLPGAKGRKEAKNAPNLKTGWAIFQDSEAEMERLTIPYYGQHKEAVIEAAEMLLQITAPAEVPLLEPVKTAVSGKSSVDDCVTTDQGPIYTDQTIVYQGTLSNELAEAPTLVNTPTVTSPMVSGIVNGLAVETAVSLIRRMRKQKIPHYKIAASIGLNGRYYPQYKEICTANNISLEEGNFE